MSRYDNSAATARSAAGRLPGAMGRGPLPGRLFPKRCVEDPPGAPGVVMIKIDGLGFGEVEKALERGRLPHLRKIIGGKGARLRRLYSGIPSATPAVQGELFFGVKSSVPAVSFIDRKRGEPSVMIYPRAAARMAKRLEKKGRPLLKGGTSYSNIYAGGANEARYCTETMKLRSVRQLASSVKLFMLLLARPVRLLRMAFYPLLEAGIALYDFFRGVGEGKSIAKELKFIPTRLFVCILLRELIRTRVKMDLARGVRVVHASFLGYDEQAHRRGPDSAFAHWTLKGIDAAIEDIHRSLENSPCRNYRLIVYSDHGQEAVVSYPKRYGKSFQRAVAETLSAAGKGTRPTGSADRAVFSGSRARGLILSEEPREQQQEGEPIDPEKIQVAALGPLGHVYLPPELADRNKRALARALVEKAHVPTVLFVENGAVTAVNEKGRFDLEARSKEVLGADHPEAERAAKDLAATCRHADAGDLVVSGWGAGLRPLSFAVENGAHGGPGREETSGFVLFPSGIDTQGEAFRPVDLRRRVLELLESDVSPADTGNRGGEVKSG